MTHAAPSDFTGIREFCVDLAASSGRPVDYIAIRPALTYYDRSGIPVPVQPQAPGFGDIPSRLSRMLAETCERIGTKLQISDRAFEALANAPARGTVCSATQWATSSTERGDLYLLSEANGGTSKELRQLCYGTLADGMSFGELWRSPNHHRVSQEFSGGVQRPPAWHKLAEFSLALESTLRRYSQSRYRPPGERVAFRQSKAASLEVYLDHRHRVNRPAGAKHSRPRFF